MHLLLISKNRFLYSTRRLATSALSRGWDVTVLDPRAAALGVDASGVSLLVDGEELRGVDLILPRVAPHLVEECAPLLGWAESRGIPSLTSLAGLRLAADKHAAAVALQGAGLATPESVFVQHSSQLASALRALGGAPVVAKVPQSGQGRGVVLLDSELAAKTAGEALIDAHGAMLLQRFEASAAGQDLRVFLVGGEIRGAVQRQAPAGDFRANVHRGGVGRVAKLDDAERDLALAAARAIGLEHLAGVDLIRTESGPKVLEVNASPGIEGAEGVLKLDLAAAIIERCAELLA